MFLVAVLLLFASIQYSLPVCSRIYQRESSPGAWKIPVGSAKLTFGKTCSSSIATEPLLDDELELLLEELELLELDELLDDELELELLLEDELELLDELLDEELDVLVGGKVTVQVGSLKLPSWLP